MKRFIIYILFFLLFISIYQDLSIDDSPIQEFPITLKESPIPNYTIIQIKITSGDTTLSIIEEINKQTSEKIDVSNVIADFQALNPNVDPYQLEANKFYYFPFYNK